MVTTTIMLSRSPGSRTSGKQPRGHCNSTATSAGRMAATENHALKAGRVTDMQYHDATA